MDTSSDSDSVVHKLPTGEAEEARETMHGVRSYMGWTHILEIDSTASSAEDNPFWPPNNSQ